jgi:protein TonB
MRWSMLPVSIIAHVVLFAICVVLPLSGSVEPPDPWPLSSARQFMVAAPAPPPPGSPARRASLRSDAAPLKAPDRIAPPADAPPAHAGDEPIAGVHGAEVGVPDGLKLDSFTPAPVPVPPPPPPAPPRIYRTGGAIREPRKIRDVPPVYPEIARAARVEGLVILEATIDERGVVTDARVLRSEPLLDSAALTALKQWRYTPTLLNGVPVRVLMTVTFRFSLGDRDL